MAASSEKHRHFREDAANTHAVPTDDISGVNLAFDEMITERDPASAAMEEVELGQKKKVPRRIIHFVNGDTLEEFSTDEEEEEPPAPPVNPKELLWLPWFWFWMVLVATKSLAAADFLGEKLAWFFGITSPKYQYIIDEYHKMKREDEEEAKLEQEEAESDLSTVATGDQQQDMDAVKDKQSISTENTNLQPI